MEESVILEGSCRKEKAIYEGTKPKGKGKVSHLKDIFQSAVNDKHVEFKVKTCTRQQEITESSNEFCSEQYNSCKGSDKNNKRNKIANKKAALKVVKKYRKSVKRKQLACRRSYINR